MHSIYRKRSLEYLREALKEVESASVEGRLIPSMKVQIAAHAFMEIGLLSVKEMDRWGKLVASEFGKKRANT